MSLFRKFDFNSKAVSHNGNYAEILSEEIALEGLDGITFDALLLRLNQARLFQTTLDPNSCKDFIFQVLRRLLSIVPKKDYDESNEAIRGGALQFALL
jgi:hypothetical protein